MTDIAIIGTGCRLPGAPGVTDAPDVTDVTGHWNLLLCGARQCGAVPGERRNHETVHAPGDRPFHLGGPGFAVGAACCGSLVALDRAMARLRRGTCRIALVVGGVHLDLTPDGLAGFSGLRALSRSGVCRPFDAEADGFVLGQGAGVVVLRPLADALAAGDRVHAEIKGIGSADDGASPGPLVPTAEGRGRLRAVRRAYEDAAAGLRFSDTARPFPGGGAPRRAASGSFGSGGATDHVVLEERPEPVRARPRHRAADTGSAGGAESTGSTGDAGPQLLFLSAGDPEQLDQHIGEVLDVLDAADRTPLAALAHTLGSRPPLPARLAIVATGTEAFVERLRHAREQLLAGARGDLGDGAFAADAPLPAARRRTAFLFPGQGSQQPGMMRDLYARFPAYRSAVCVLSAVARSGLGFDLADLLYGEASVPRADLAGRAFPVDNGELGRRLAATEVCQPLLGTVQIAATRVLADCGVTPGLALGHSAGEFAAAAAAGALTPVDAVRLLVHRGAALRRAGTGLRGGMLAVQTDKETCRRLADGIDDVWLACFNQPRQIVVSGTPEGLAALREACAGAGIVTAALDVSNAFHSPRLARAEEVMRADLATRRIGAPAVPFVSSVNAEVCADPEQLRALWARHASAPVRFDEAVRTAYDQGARVFLQVGGGSALLTSVRRNLAGRGDVQVVPVTGEVPDDGRTFVLALARLAVLGAPVDPRALIAEGDRRLLDLGRGRAGDG
ncbi:acyltransferase domain-containing protein [Streptomyces sp. NPDC051563]|uniref:acyltransferase domain-containing protein n=1 Tax=Streptomyces sp. NPDC051563 TaxID=3365659 RepID=UPI0037BC9B47